MTAPAAAPAARGVVADVPAGRVFARACAAEWTRLWTVRTTWWFLAAAAVVTVGLGLLAGNDAATDAVPPRGEPAWVASSVTALPAQFAFIALALTAVTSDYATGGIVPALQWTTRRTVLFLSRALVVVATATSLAVVLAAASAVAAFTVARPVLALPLDEGVEVLSRVALVVSAGTALAVGLGFLLRSTAGALVTVFLLMVVLPVMLPNLGSQWATDLGGILPGSGATFLLLGEPQRPGVTDASSALTVLAWGGGALLLGWLRLVRDDVTR